MARHLFGLSSADLAMEVVGDELRIRPGAIGTVHDAVTGGATLTDLQDLTLAAITVVTADSVGRVGFWGPDGAYLVFVDFGFGRFAMVATDMASTLGTKLDLTGGVLTGDLTINQALNVLGNADLDGTLTLGGAAAFASTLLAVGKASSDERLEGPIIQGGDGSGENLLIQSTSHATKGRVTVEAGLISPFMINAQTGTTYTLVLADNSKLVTLSNTGAITLTVPTNASVAFPIGTQINLAQLNTGQVTVVGAGGVTVNGTPGLKLTDRYASASLIKTGTDTWLLVGRLTA